MIFFHSGTIGRSWAVLFAMAGYSVYLFDVDSNQLRGAKVAVSAMLCQKLAGHKENVQQFLTLISYSDNLADTLKDAIYVQVLYELRCVLL